MSYPHLQWVGHLADYQPLLEIPEDKQVLEDKYQAMKHAKGWEEEDDDYALFASPPNKKGPKKAFKGRCGYCGNLDAKQLIVPTRKATKISARNRKLIKRKSNITKVPQGKGHLDMSKIKCFNCGEYGHFAHDCLNGRDNANIAQESEQKGNPCWI